MEPSFGISDLVVIMDTSFFDFEEKSLGLTWLDVPSNEFVAGIV